jgi:hypothetical protein
LGAAYSLRATRVYFWLSKLVAKKEKLEQFKRFGYPIWFMRLLGLAEILACVCLLFSQTRYYSIGIFMVILIGAIYTHLKVNDSKKEIMAPIIVVLHLLVIFFYGILV